MSAFCPKRTWTRALHMSAFGGKAYMTIWTCLLLRSLLGVKRTWAGALHMSAFDPKRTSVELRESPKALYRPKTTLRGGYFPFGQFSVSTARWIIAGRRPNA